MARLSPYRASLSRILVFCTVIAYSGAVQSQGLSNQSNLYIPAGLELHVDGDFVNTGFVQNQGIFLVSGHWKNANVYQGLGQVVLNGILEQDFFNNNNAVFQLVVEGGGSKNIRGRLPVTNQLALLSGIVIISDNDTLLLDETALVKGGSQQSYVDGEFTYVGAGYKFFPIGKNGIYSPVEMLNISGIQPVTALEVFEDLPAIKLPPRINLFTKVYWQRKSISGSFTGSPVTIWFPIPDSYTNRHNIEIVQGDDLTSDFTSLGLATVTNNGLQDKITPQSALTKSIFAIGESIPIDGIPGEFYFSTSLSPRAANDDNRVIKVFGNQLVEENFRFQVFNRWGLEVFETTSLESMIVSGWDGRQQGNGNHLPSGGYPFLLRVVTKTGEVIEKRGIISIVN